MDENYGISTGPFAGGPQPPRAGTKPTVVVPLDGTDRSMVALPVARTLGKTLGGTLHVVYVTDRPLPLLEVNRRLGLRPEQMEGAVLDELSGPVGERIAEFASQSPDSLVVMSAHSAQVGPGEELGPVTERVLAESTTPVLLVRPELSLRDWAPHRVLLPHDGSPVTAAGFRPAVHLAELAESSLYVLHVATLGAESTPGSLPVPPYVDQPHHEWPEWTREFLERMDVFTDLPTGLQPRLFLSKGEPAAEIVRFANERSIDLIALSWHGSLELKHAGTLKKVILNAPCPVLFSKAPELEPEQRRGGTIDLRQSGPYLHS
jgi:nucleotide-binding universal stress UspA family protein